MQNWGLVALREHGDGVQSGRTDRRDADEAAPPHGEPAWRAVAVTNVGLDQHVSGGWVGMHSDAIYAGRQPPPGGNPSSQVQPDQCHRRQVWLVLATAKGGHQAGYGPGGGRVPAATPQPDSSSGGEVGVSW